MTRCVWTRGALPARLNDWDEAASFNRVPIGPRVSAASRVARVVDGALRLDARGVALAVKRLGRAASFNRVPIGPRVCVAYRVWPELLMARCVWTRGALPTRLNDWDGPLRLTACPSGRAFQWSHVWPELLTLRCVWTRGALPTRLNDWDGPLRLTACPSGRAFVAPAVKRLPALVIRSPSGLQTCKWCYKFPGLLFLSLLDRVLQYVCDRIFDLLLGL